MSKVQNGTGTEREFCNVKEIASRLGKSTRTIAGWAAMGKIPSVKIAGSRLYPWQRIRRTLLRRSV